MSGTGKRFRSKCGAGVGLDIGTYSVKMLEISGSQGKVSLVSSGKRDVQGLSQTELSASIKSLSEELKITAKDVNISLSGPSVAARVIAMPDMTDEELKSAVKLEAEKFIPFDINDCVIDYYTQKRDAADKRKLSVLLVAAKTDSILAKIKIVEDAGLNVGLVDVDSFAVANAFIGNAISSDPSKTMALLNIGSAYINLIILRDGVVSFVRDLAIAVMDLLRPQDKKAERPASVEESLANLVDEIKLSFGYHENQSGRSVDEIYLSGGGAGFAGLGDAVSDTIGCAPKLWSPLQSFYIDPSKIGAVELTGSNSSFVVSAGLALRGCL